MDVDVVLFNTNASLKNAVQKQAAKAGIRFRFIDHNKINEATIILATRGITAPCEMERLMLEEYRQRAIVLIKPSMAWELFHDVAGLETLEQHIQSLGYPYVAAGQNREALAIWGVSVIKSLVF